MTLLLVQINTVLGVVCDIICFMKVKIEKIIYPGKSLARIDRKVVMLDRGLPGEEVEFTCLKSKSNYTEGKVSEVLVSSAERVPPHCDHYLICSPYQAMNYTLQSEIKKTQLKGMISHNLKFEPKKFEFRPASKIWGYRNKMDLHVVWESKKPFFAYNLPGKIREFRKIDKCFLASKNVNILLERLAHVMSHEKPGSIKDITIRETSSGELLLVIYGALEIKSFISTENIDFLKKGLSLSGVLFTHTGSGREKILWGKNLIEEKINGYKFLLGPTSFFQINIPMLGALLKDMEKALELKGTERILDLFCGVGTFGIIFAGSARETTGVELSGESAGLLKKNIKLNGVNNFRAFGADSCDWLSRAAENRFDVLIVDPPRRGLGGRLCGEILKKRIPRIFYISCDPSTLLRDLKELLSIYELKSITAYDFFPHTPHIETLSVLTLRK